MILHPYERFVLFVWFYLGKMWKFLEKLPFFRADMAGLGKYCTGGYGRIGVYRVKLRQAFLPFVLTTRLIPSPVRPSLANYSPWPLETGPLGGSLKKKSLYSQLRKTRIKLRQAYTPYDLPSRSCFCQERALHCDNGV